jgi:citrate synthase
MVSLETDSLTYRGYPVQELRRWCSFEEVAYLLWHGELPTRDQISAQNRIERAQRALDPGIAAAIADQPFTAHPMDTLRTTVSLLGADDPAMAGITPSIRAEALRLFAVLPSIIAADQRRRQGLGAIAPRDHLGYAANFLYMTFGKVPEPQVVAAFETSLILYAEHSTSACSDRVLTATSSDLYSAVAAPIGTLNDSPHACASEAVMRMLNEIAIPDNAKPWLEEALTAGREIVGFSHHVCENGDSRVATMRAALGMIAVLRGGQDLVETYDALATAVHEATELRPNLDYPVGPAYHLIGLDASAFTPILVAATIPGWTARIAGQLSPDSLIPPLAAADDGSTEHHPALEKGDHVRGTVG